MKKHFTLSIVLMLLLSNLALAQSTVSGTVTDAGNGDTLIGATVIIEGTTTGGSTDVSGNYTFSATPGSYTLIVTYVGYEDISRSVTISSGSNNFDFAMVEGGTSLNEVLVTGTRNRNRTVTETAVPVDVIDMSDFALTSPQVTVNEILNYVAPSFTSQTQTVSDGTDHIDPASLRGLGPDQVLVLINGKRRHNTSLINVNGTVGAGSVGTDMNAIPTASIDRIEVLRDGAAAQYGSDAIAGVINIILKKDTNKLNLAITTGANFSSNSNQFDGGVDGEKIQIDANFGVSLGKKGGFINFTGSMGSRQPSLRNKDYAGDIFKGFHGVEREFASSGGVVADMDLADYQNSSQDLTYLDAATKTRIAGLDVSIPADQDTLRSLLNFDADQDELDARGMTRKDFRFKVGTSKLREGKFFANMILPVGDNAEVYTFGGMSFRQGLASGFYRRPAQGDGRANTPAFPNGFLPNIGSDIVDKSLAIGIRGKVGEWDVDFSNTFGQNTFKITVGNSSNGTLGVATPRSFDAGGFSFLQNTSNLDFSKFYKDIFQGFNVAVGAEYKLENFQIKAGEESSYTSYDVFGNPVNSVTPSSELVRNNFTGAVLGGGSQVYRGFDPGNATNKYRNSFATYLDLEADITKAWMLSLAGRFESFSDFGETFNYKIATRYNISDAFGIRAAHSTGFRAPSLHQQFFSRTSTIFQNNIPLETGTFTNDSRAATLIGIDPLKQETSSSISGGLTGSFGKLSVTVDAYQISINDRIVYSGSFGPGSDPELQQIFLDAGATSARFFVNAIDTKTQGVDVVISYPVNIGSMLLKNDLGASFMETDVTNVNVPDKIATAGQSGNFFDAQEEAFLTLAQPRAKISLTDILSMGKWDFMLRNVYFGSVTDPDDYRGVGSVGERAPNDDSIYGAKVVTDLSVSTNLSDDFRITVGANNLLDVYPDLNRPGGTSGDQFVYSRRTSQFGYTGRYLFARLTFDLK